MADRPVAARARRRPTGSDRKSRGLALAGLGAVLLAAWTARAADPPPIAPAVPAPTLEPADKATLQKVHDQNQVQIQTGKLAEDKGGSRAVRDLGRRIVNDAVVSERKLDEYLRTRGTDLSALATRTNVDPAHELLATRAAEEFDRAYVQQTVSDLQATLDLLTSERVATADDNLRLLYDGLIDTATADKKAAEDLLAGMSRTS